MLILEDVFYMGFLVRKLRKVFVEYKEAAIEEYMNCNILSFFCTEFSYRWEVDLFANFLKLIQIK